MAKTFDIEAARAEGYSDTEIAQHLAQSRGFDLAGAKAEGYSDAEIVQHLAGAPASSNEPQEPDMRAGRGTNRAAGANKLPTLWDKLREAKSAYSSASPNPVGSFLGGVTDTLSLGTVDHAAAGVKTLVGGDDYKTNLQEVRQANERENQPLRIAGQVVGGLVMPAAAGAPRVVQGGNKLANTAKVVGTSAGAGAVYGGASGELEDIQENALTGGGLGLVFGAAGQGIAKALNNRKVALARSEFVEDLPPVQAVKSGAQALYQKVDDLGVALKPKPLLDSFTAFRQQIGKEGYAKSSPLASAKAIHSVLDDLETAVGTQRLSWKELENIRRRIQTERAGTADKDTSRLMGRLLNHLDDMVTNAPSNAFMTPRNAGEALKLTKEARTAWRQAAKADVIQGFVDKLIVRADTQDTRSLHKVMMSNFAQFRQSKQWNLFSKDEQDFLIKTFREGAFDKLLNRLESFNQGALGAVGSSVLATTTSGATLPVNLATYAGTKLRDSADNKLMDSVARQFASGRFFDPNTVPGASLGGASAGGMLGGSVAANSIN